MSFDALFDQVHNKNTKGMGVSKEESSENDFDTLFEQIQSKQPSRSESLVSAPIKGLIKGAAKFSPLPSSGPVPYKLGERLTEKFFPTHKGKAPEEILEFAGENIPTAFMGEGGLLKKGIQALSGGLAKKGAKELELPEWAQDIVGAAGMVVPGALQAAGTKALRPSAKQQSMVNFLKSEGLSDKDITPMMQDSKKVSWLSKLASKFEKKSLGFSL